MYNESQKLAFISDYTLSVKSAAFVKKIFGWFEKYEQKYGADLSLLPAEILQPILNQITGLRTKSVEPVLIILREYVKWCEKNGYGASREIYNVKIDTIEKIRNQMVASPLHLKECLNKFFDLPKNETLDIVYRVFLWMAFAGMADTDAVRVCSYHVDLENLVIRFEGCEYGIYKEGKEDFEKACRLVDFNFHHSNYFVRRKRADGDTIMRGYGSGSANLLSIRPILNKRVEGKSRKEKLSYRRVYLSGIFYREYERERAGLGVNFSKVVAEEMKRREQIKKYTVTKTRTRNVIANMIEREYLTDYNKWKIAFER